MRAVDVIRVKRDGGILPPDAIRAFVDGATTGTWSDDQLGAMLMAIVLRGMTADETAVLTDAMVASGVRLDLSDLPAPRIDKHSTGGVGDKTSLVLAPLVAACGATVPMMSGRGLGHTGGTLDKLEAIPGFRTALTDADMRQTLKAAGCCIVGQTREIAPADRKLYALRDVTATVESLSLITASIMSKKIAEGIDTLVLDVKVGRGAFMKTLDEARALARSLVLTGQRAGVRTEALITAMDAPLGRTIGNALEVGEAIEALRGAGPADFMEVVYALAVRMLVCGGVSDTEADARARVERALASGDALERFRTMVDWQEGDPRVIDDLTRLPRAPLVVPALAGQSGTVVGVDAEQIGRAAMALGAGRARATDEVDPAVGVVMRVVPGDRVGAGDALADVHGRDASAVEHVSGLIREAIVLGDAAPSRGPLVLERVS
jgi:pyrimidine-nucleoside phosphorylase